MQCSVKEIVVLQVAKEQMLAGGHVRMGLITN
jgi:hypothetical protein